jgi:hypothetical protein
MFWLFAMAIWVAMLILPLMLLIALLPVGRECPRCSSETLPIRFVLVQPFRRLVSRRWCVACGWEGISRRANWACAAGKLAPVVQKRSEPEDDAAWNRGL